MSPQYELPHTWEEPEALMDFLAIIRETRPDANIRRIRYAYFVAEEAHAGQVRTSGEPYVTHPLAVAAILAELKMDDDTLIAALLHDTLEDCPSMSRERLSELFGEDVAKLIEGVTKLRFKPQEGQNERQRVAAETNRAAESLRKMLLAMAQDVRVMIIKLADRLHNMQTLDALRPDKRIRIAAETLDVYAPLAARLGIWQIKWQLEDLAFKHLHPQEFDDIRSRVAKSRTEREDELREAILILKDRLEAKGVRVSEVQGRPKHLFSIFNKIVKHGFQFEDILDLIALRVVVFTTADCYVALGVVNELWIPIPNYFSDYIARPKPNGYQSLHTKVIGPRGEPLEIQIRTKQMHEIAEMGVAAHYAYKEGGDRVDERFAGLRQRLYDWSSDNQLGSDFMRNLSTDLFSEQVFVFTPKGDVMDLPSESTPVDFAFRVHTNLGLHLVGAKVNGVMVPLSHKLQNGDIVEVITRANATPSFDWLEFVKSPSARSKLRGYFRAAGRDEYIQRGRAALEREAKGLGLEPKDYLGDNQIKLIAKDVKDCETPADVLAKVGEGLVSAQSVLNKLRGVTQKPKAEGVTVRQTKEQKPMLIAGGVDNLMIRRSKCCDPIPGDDVVGFVTRGRGIMIHRKVCSNMHSLANNEPERVVPLEWNADGQFYSVGLKIITVNRSGLLMDIAVVFAETKTNVSKMKVNTVPNATAEIEIRVDVSDIEHLNTVLTKVSQFSDVISILRVTDKGR